MAENPILWSPNAKQRQDTAMFRFMQEQGFASYDDLYRWSIDEPAAFWTALVRFCDIDFAESATTVLSRPENIMDAGWFDDGKLNFAANLLRASGDRAALIAYGEDGSRSELSFDELRTAVAQVAAGLRAAGDTRTPLGIGAATNVVNVFLVYEDCGG